MKKWVTGLFLFPCLAGMLMFAGNAIAASKVVVVTGIAEQSLEEVESYLYVHQGIREALGGSRVTLEFQYVELDEAPDAETREKWGKNAAEKALASNPDVIIVLNDEAVMHVAMNIDDVPVVFGFIFSNPDQLGLPRDNITGVTRRSFAPDIWNLARQIFDAQTVGLISKESRSMMGVRHYIMAQADELEKASGVRVQEMYLLNTFEEWESQIKHWEHDLIYLADTSRIEKDGENMSSDDIVAWTVANAAVPVIAANERDTRAGALFSIVTDERQIGFEAGEKALQIIGGTPVSDIPMAPTATGRLLLNAATLEKTGADLNYDIITSADQIFE